MKRELAETWNGLGNEPILFPTVDLIDAACKHGFFSTINFIFPYFKLSFQFILVFFLCMELSFIRRKMEKTRSVKEKWMERCLFPARVGISPLINNMIEVLFPICALIWRVNTYVSRQGKV